MTPNIGSWVRQQLPKLDTPNPAERHAACDDLYRMLYGVGERFANMPALLARSQRPPHLDRHTPVNAKSVGLLLVSERDRIPLPELLPLGDLQRRLKAGERPTSADLERVLRVRDQVAELSA